MAFYRICPDCGAYLDPGERCSCHEERLIEMERKEKAKIIGKANDDGCSPVEATVDGKTSYGIRQKIVSRGTNDTLDEAKKEAREILADDGKPKEEITIKLPDIKTCYYLAS